MTETQTSDSVDAEKVEQYKDLVFATPRIQDIKLRVHEQFSDVPIDTLGSVADVAGLTVSEDIADVGCGTGLFLQYLREERGHQGALYGIDFTEGVMATAIRTNRDRGLGIHYLISDAQSLCLTSDSVDAVFMQHMLGFVPDLQVACQEARRVLRSGGVCVATANSLKNYPHVQRYREEARKLLGWESLTINNFRFNSENMGDVLGSVFPRVETYILEGHLRIPSEEFAQWFDAMMDNWHPLPTQDQRLRVMTRLREDWMGADLDAEGYIGEPKWFGIVAGRTV